ncbi:MAG: M23 family metallopeptidase [Clostridiales bacterium]|nr:M23 family metallopeptidase [Clostridiales bacterium]
MRKKMLKQAGISVLIVLALFIATNSNIKVLEKGADTVMTQMRVNYTVDDVKAAAKVGVKAVSSIPAKAQYAATVMSGKASYGEPIDERYEGKRANVYSVGAGQVIAVGENEEIGRYIRILHGGDGESLYGNLKEIFVEVPTKVKKGQMIGVYEKKKNKKFHYSFKDFN